MHASPARVGPRWFVREDIDGLLGLALDNLIQILLDRKSTRLNSSH